MGLDSHQAVAGRSNGHGPKNTYRSRGECALVIQMACTHSAAMAVFNRVGGAAGDRTVSAMASAAARLLRAYATQVEALRRLRHGRAGGRLAGIVRLPIAVALFDAETSFND